MHCKVWWINAAFTGSKTGRYSEWSEWETGKEGERTEKFEEKLRYKEYAKIIHCIGNSKPIPDTTSIF